MARKSIGGPVVPDLLRESTQRAAATTGLSNLHEGRVEKALNGRTTYGSGSQEFDKGDVKNVHVGPFELLIECKATSKLSMKFLAKWLVKITDEAGPNRIPAISIHFSRSSLDRVAKGVFRRNIPTEEEWIAVPMSVFEQLVNHSEVE